MDNLGTLVKAIGIGLRQFGKELVRENVYHLNPLNDLEAGRMLSEIDKSRTPMKHLVRGGVVGAYAGVALYLLGVDKYVAVTVIGSGPVLDPLQYYIRAIIDNYRNSNGNEMSNDRASN